MKPEAQRIAIAEACGWRFHAGSFNGMRCATHPAGYNSTIEHVPDYLNDLNAMHEAEKVLSEAQRKDYAHRLHPSPRSRYDHLGDDFLILHSTAAQRAEAFLRCTGRWVDAAIADAKRKGV